MIKLTKEEREKEKEQKYLEILEGFYVDVVRESKTKNEVFIKIENLDEIIEKVQDTFWMFVLDSQST